MISPRGFAFVTLSFLCSIAFLPVAKADSAPVMQVTGTMTFGNVETVNFTFQWTCTVEAPVGPIQICDNGHAIDGSAFASATGAFTFASMTSVLDSGYIGFDPSSDIGQFYVNDGFDFSGKRFPFASPSALQLLQTQAEIYDCTSQACIDAFGLQGQAVIGVGGPVLDGDLQYTVTEVDTRAVPEPATALLVSLGGCCLALYRRRKQQAAV